MINMEQIYDDMKAVLSFFGLNFSEMTKVNVRIHKEEIEYSFERMKITIPYISNTENTDGEKLL